MPTTDAATPFTCFAESFLVRTCPHVEASTIDAYRFVLDHYLTPYFGAEAIGSFGRGRLKDWLSELSTRPAVTGGTIGRGTIRMACSLATYVFEDAVDSGFLAMNPAARLGGRYRRKRGRRPPMPVYNRAERAHFIRTAFLVAPECAPVYAVYGYAGLRVSEGRGLWPRDIHDRKITVERQLTRKNVEKNPKFDSFGDVDVVDELAEILAPLVRRGGRYLFPGRYAGSAISYGQLQANMATVAEVAGLHRIPMKNLRHTCASIMVSEGESLEYVRRNHRHSSIEITVDLYGRWLPMAPSRLRTARACACERPDTAGVLHHPTSGPPGPVEDPTRR